MVQQSPCQVGGIQNYLRKILEDIKIKENTNNFNMDEGLNIHPI